MTANDRKPYRSYLNKLVDECNNTDHHQIDNKLVDADHTFVTEKN